ncbi:MAG: response regulator [Rubrivivax sp.]
MATPRALVIDDDASIRRFVAMALEEEPLELLQAESVQQALERLRRDGPFCLVLTDLMLPDGSGIDLMQAMAAEPSLRGAAQVVAFSAGIQDEQRRQLLELGVEEVIDKPAPVLRLLQAARRALAAVPAAPAAPAAADGAAQAVQTYFGGNQALFDAYRDSCRAQFALDRRQGDAHVAAADWPALRRLAHSLKSVLLTLGHDEASAVARQLESDAAAGLADAARQGWAGLAAALDRLAA